MLLAIAIGAAAPAQAEDFVVSTLHDGGAGSLRAAIEAANVSAGPHTITFSVNGTIVLDGALPAITSSVTVDATGAASRSTATADAAST